MYAAGTVAMFRMETPVILPLSSRPEPEAPVEVTFESEAAANFVDMGLPPAEERGRRRMRDQDLEPIPAVDNTFRSEFGITVRSQTPLTDEPYVAAPSSHGRNSSFSIPIEHYTGSATKEL